MILQFLDSDHQVVHERHQDLGYVPEFINWADRLYVRVYEGPTVTGDLKVVYHQEHCHPLE